MKLKKPKKIKKSKAQLKSVNLPIKNVSLGNDMNNYNDMNNNMNVASNNENFDSFNNANIQPSNQQNNQLTQQQGQNQAISNKQIRAIHYEYWKLYNYYCAKFTQYCRAVTSSYQLYINDMIRNTVQQSLQSKIYQGQSGNNNSFCELNSSLSNLLYYKLIDNLVNNNQNQQFQQPAMMPQFPNPAQFANFAPINNQPVTSNLMADPNAMANNPINNAVNDSNAVNNVPNININTSETSSSLLSPEITNRFKNKIDKILAQ